MRARGRAGFPAPAASGRGQGAPRYYGGPPGGRWGCRRFAAKAEQEQKKGVNPAARTEPETIGAQLVVRYVRYRGKGNTTWDCSQSSTRNDTCAACVVRVVYEIGKKWKRPSTSCERPRPRSTAVLRRPARRSLGMSKVCSQSSKKIKRNWVAAMFTAVVVIAVVVVVVVAVVQK